MGFLQRGRTQREVLAVQREVVAVVGGGFGAYCVGMDWQSTLNLEEVFLHFCGFLKMDFGRWLEWRWLPARIEAMVGFPFLRKRKNLEKSGIEAMVGFPFLRKRKNLEKSGKLLTGSLEMSSPAIAELVYFGICTRDV
ncbi:hypothetical protein AMTR_s00151p00067880 [Amborella trichopoda]|uniref:Uncharacterized protein n=1 Tax=Amborella trichopoda TaxID=13333 RepID=W1NI88_AMBTC|nr:hypothetical protein AMTR_s00151p00067880 [Amborella trichopoda]